MEFPVIINGRTVGKMTVCKNGGKTVIDAKCSMQPGIIRLSAYGCGKEIYLGVMQPENGVLHIHRHFTPNEARQFPHKFSHAAPRGEKQPEEDTVWTSDQLGILYTSVDGESLCAIPNKLGIRHRGEELPGRIIEGEYYRIFKIGKITRT